ncbi:MAG TPA: hypothetical protein PKA27_07860 [Fimbriimonadaceae bacterium]|nr:hypothetical protein [Fimbriimonadaceae bacterium]
MSNLLAMGVAKKSLAGIQVGEVGGGDGNVEFDWEVKAVRSRFKNYEVLRPWTNRLTPGSDPTRAYQDRLTSHRKNQEYIRGKN